MADKLIVGIDISKDWLDLCASDAAGVERIANTPEVVAAWLERVGAGLIAFEPTGGYERTLIAAVRERGIAFVRVHPNDVVAFRKSRGTRPCRFPIGVGKVWASPPSEPCERFSRTRLSGCWFPHRGCLA